MIVEKLMTCLSEKQKKFDDKNMYLYLNNNINLNLYIEFPLLFFYSTNST